MSRAIGLIEEAVTRPKCIKYYQCMQLALKDHGIFTCIKCSWYKEIPRY
jgi:hypothetical protein